MPTEAIGLQRQLGVTAALRQLAQFEQQAAAPAFQPGILIGRGDVLPYRFWCLALIQAFPAVVHHQITIHVVTFVKSPGLGRKRYLFILLVAQLHQYEIGPALAQVAEKHQPQSVKQGHVVQADYLCGDVW